MLNIWTNASLSDFSLSTLRTGIALNRLLMSDKLTNKRNAADPDLSLAEADIAFGLPQPQQLLGLTRLKWIHINAAGYTPYDRPDIREHLKRQSIRVTNSSSVFDEPCANHALAFMLAAARDFPAAFANQLGPRQWPQAQIRSRCRLLTGQSVLLLGFGAIARRLVELLHPFHMNIHAVRRTSPPPPGPAPVPGHDEPIPVHSTADIESLLPAADHVVNILPANASTNHFMNAPRFALMKPGSVFYNIDRGSTVDQPALIESLTAKHLAAAYLDVTDPEPLPPDHPLWAAPNCFITPHSAGGHVDEFDRLVEHFLENLRRFQAAMPLLDQILK